MCSFNSHKKNRTKTSPSLIWLTALFLTILAVATVSVVGSSLYHYAHQTDCQISLYDGWLSDSSQSENLIEKLQDKLENITKSATSQLATVQPQADESRTGQSVANQTVKQQVTDEKAISGSIVNSQAARYSGSQAAQEAQKSAFDVEDKDQIWKTETAIELFNSEYTNANGAVTVKSADGRKVIAPGTEGSYTFSLKNTSTAAADYKIWVEAKLSSNMTGVPIETRMSGYHGWMLGDKENWKAAADLDGVSTEETIGAGQSAEYTIYWKWPFEQGKDERDTGLGDSAVNQEMTYTVTIYTLTATAAPVAGEGTTASGKPQNSLLQKVTTGDTTQILIWIILLMISAGLVAWLLWKKRRQGSSR